MAIEKKKNVLIEIETKTFFIIMLLASERLKMLK